MSPLHTAGAIYLTPIIVFYLIYTHEYIALSKLAARKNNINLLQGWWRGRRRFWECEADAPVFLCEIICPFLFWMRVFVGDPLINPLLLPKTKPQKQQKDPTTNYFYRREQKRLTKKQGIKDMNGALALSISNNNQGRLGIKK